MARKDYYLILGVSRSETPRGIQRAFRELARRHHPDRMGPESTAAFQDIVEAYEVLSNPERRRQYNRDLPRTQPLEAVPSEPPLSSARPQPEPLIPESRSGWPSYQPEPLIPEPLSIRDDFGTYSPSFEALAARLLRNFTGAGVPKGEDIESLNLEVLLSPAEAMRGGVIRVGIPTFSPCAACRGTGRDWFSTCHTCMGQGMTAQEELLAVRIPPMIHQDTILEVPLGSLNIHNFYLRLHIRLTR